MLSNKTLEQYLQLLSSQSPTPGGGSSLALVACNALALCKMALNVSKCKLSAQNQKSYDSVIAEIDELFKVAFGIIDKDAQSFEAILSAMRMPQNTDAEKSTRQQALQSAFIESATVCLNLMQISAFGCLLANKVIEMSNKYVASDAVIGKELLTTVAKSCPHNVYANTDMISDKQIQQELNNKVRSYLALCK